MAQLENVHSVLRLNYETLRGFDFIGLTERCKTYLYENVFTVRVAHNTKRPAHLN